VATGNKPSGGEVPVMKRAMKRHWKVFLGDLGGTSSLYQWRTSYLGEDVVGWEAVRVCEYALGGSGKRKEEDNKRDGLMLGGTT